MDRDQFDAWMRAHFGQGDDARAQLANTPGALEALCAHFQLPPEITVALMQRHQSLAMAMVRLLECAVRVEHEHGAIPGFATAVATLVLRQMVAMWPAR